MHSIVEPCEIKKMNCPYQKIKNRKPRIYIEKKVGLKTVMLQIIVQDVNKDKEMLIHMYIRNYPNFKQQKIPYSSMDRHARLEVSIPTVRKGHL